MKKIFTFFLSILLFVNIFSVVAFADVPSTQKAVSTSGTWSSLPFNATFSGNYYIIQDATGIPSSTYLSPYFFFTTDQEKFYRVPGIKVFSAVLNKIVGIVFDPSELNSLFTDFQTAIGGTDTVNNKYIRNCVYDGNDNFLGVAINDISGCYYGGNTPDNTNVKDDGNYGNNVKNFIDYQKEQGNFDVPDYFTFYGLSDTYILNNLGSALSSSQNDVYQQFRYNNDFIYGVRKRYDADNKLYFFNGYSGSVNVLTGYSGVVSCVAADNDSKWNDFVNAVVVGNELLGSEFVFNYSNGEHWITLTPLDENNNTFSTYNSLNPYSSSESSTISGTKGNLYLYTSDNMVYMPFNFEKITIYRNSGILNQFNTNVYSPSVFYTDSFKNYSTENDNSLDMAIGVIDQSVQYNNDIYDNSVDNFYNYYDNGTYDQSSSTTNVTNITNNYYNGGSDNPDNPDNPDSPVLDEILRAILRFFNAIGDIIGTILAGLLNMIDSVLEAIAGIMEDLTGLTDFFSSLFSWIPDPVPQIIGVGISLCILAAIIKFIRG